MPYSGPIYIDDVMPILERMRTSKIFYSGVIPKLELLERDIRGLITATTRKVRSEGPVSDAVVEILTVLDRVRWITSGYRRARFAPKPGEERLQIWPLFIELYNIVLKATEYGSDSGLQNRACDYITKLH